MRCRLSELRVGERATVVGFCADSPGLLKRIRALGLLKGERVLLEEVAPLRGPVKVRVGGNRISLRREEAEGILVEKEDLEEVKR